MRYMVPNRIIITYISKSDQTSLGGLALGTPSLEKSSGTAQLISGCSSTLGATRFDCAWRINGRATLTSIRRDQCDSCLSRPSTLNHGESGIWSASVVAPLILSRSRCRVRYVVAQESINYVRPEFYTGAEALADWISTGSCPLKYLDVSWNTIRLDSAVYFGNAVACERFRSRCFARGTVLLLL